MHKNSKIKPTRNFQKEGRGMEIKGVNLVKERRKKKGKIFWGLLEKDNMCFTLLHRYGALETRV
jgi:hypothetical protein